MSDYETSAEIGDLAKALVGAQMAMPSAVKDAKNPHLRNTYADLGSVRAAVLPVFLAHGIAVTQGAAIGEAGHVAVVTQFTHVSGQWMRSRVEVPYQEQKGTNIAQAYGSALSYARRYALSALACVVAEDDDGTTAAPPRIPVAVPWQPPAEPAAPAPPSREEQHLARLAELATAGELAAFAAGVPADEKTPRLRAAFTARLAAVRSAQ